MPRWHYSTSIVARCPRCVRPQAQAQWRPKPKGLGGCGPRYSQCDTRICCAQVVTRGGDNAEREQVRRRALAVNASRIEPRTLLRRQVVDTMIRSRKMDMHDNICLCDSLLWLHRNDVSLPASTSDVTSEPERLANCSECGSKGSVACHLQVTESDLIPKGVFRCGSQRPLLHHSSEPLCADRRASAWKGLTCRQSIARVRFVATRTCCDLRKS